MAKPVVMIVDDDPSHLKLYGWIVERGGFAVHPVLAAGQAATLPLVSADVAVLDYRLGPIKSIDVAQRLRQSAPPQPIILLSDALWMPEEFTDVASKFVRKGEPQQLLDAIAELLNA